AQRFARAGFRREALTPVYGLGEATLAVTFTPAGRGPRIRDGVVSVGRPLPGFEVEIRNGDGREGEADGTGRVGRVWVRGPSLMEGYLGRPRATARALRDGWLDTGDLGFLRDGELFLTGRAKDLVILRGRNYGPEEIEAAAAAVPGARPGCAVAASVMVEGGNGSGDREELVVFVEAGRETADELRRRLPRAVREAVVGTLGLPPDRVEVLAPGTLPRTSSGKLRRGETVRRWLAGKLDPPAAVTPWRLARAVAASALAFARARTGEPGPGGPAEAADEAETA
ncbi:MAG TPA: AMP-binding protein, partial [Thermoanaerobaculia bacterium]